MEIIAVLTRSQQHVIDRILAHLGVETLPPPSTGPPLWLQIRQARAYYDDNPGVLPEDEVDAPHPSDDLYIVDVQYPD